MYSGVIPEGSRFLSFLALKTLTRSYWRVSIFTFTNETRWHRRWGEVWGLFTGDLKFEVGSKGEAGRGSLGRAIIFLCHWQPKSRVPPVQTSTLGLLLPARC